MSVNLALIQKAGPLRVDTDETVTASSPSSTTTVRQELTTIYESYAIMYPNQRLAEERKERNSLLRAVSAASEATLLNPPKKQRRGWLGSLLFGGADDDKSAAAEASFPESDDDRLIYRDVVVQDNDDDLLCGTTVSLDVSCIPAEAHAMARFHLASRRSHVPNVARTAWERPGTACVTIVGLGLLVEYPETAAGQAVVMTTSDRPELLAYYEVTTTTTQAAASSTDRQRDTLSYPVAQARAALMGPNLLAVSWGLLNDGHVVFYRRITARQHPDKDWEAVATFGPTRAVLDQLGDVFADDDDQQQQADGAAVHVLQQQPLLQVTDVVPLVVEQHGNADRVAACVVVARLGGCMELVPLPHAMWYGPEINVPPSKKKKRSRTTPRGGSNNNHIPHYTADRLRNLAQEQSRAISVLTTTEYHTDILALDTFLTSIKEDAVWNPKLYPESPPAEYVLAATGTQPDGDQVITFWSVSIVYPDVVRTGDPIGFSIVARLSEALSIGPAGPDISIFATETIFRHWRKPRQVELKPDSRNNNNNNNEAPLLTSSEPPVEKRVTTVSVPAPVVSIRFICHRNMVRAAALDWNGGVRVFDCDLLERAVSHSLSPDEYGLLYRNADPDAIVPLVTNVNSRRCILDQIMATFCLDEKNDDNNNNNAPIVVAPTITRLEWSGITSATRLASHGEPMVAVIATHQPASPPVLYIVDPTMPEDVPIAVELPADRCTALHRFRDRGSLALVWTRMGRRHEHSHHRGCGVEVLFGALHQLGAREIVKTLAQESKLRQAVEASRALNPEDQKVLYSVVEECKKKLWESARDLQSLELVVDDRYVVDQALHFFESSSSNNDNNDDEITFDLFRRVHALALRRLSKPPVRLGAAIALGGLEGTGPIADQIRDRLIKLGTYELLCRHFETDPSFELFHDNFLSLKTVDLAKSLARASDMSALSVVCFRHRRECLGSIHQNNVLDELPLTLDVEDYQHLLPVVRGPGYFLDGKALVPLYHMPAYVEKRFGLDCTRGVDDAQLVEEHAKRQSSDTDGASNGSLDSEGVASLGEWYLARVKKIEQFLSSPKALVAFTSVALAAFGLEADSRPPGTVSQTAERLKLLHRRYQILFEILLEQNFSSAGKMAPDAAGLGLDELASLDPVSLLAMIMGTRANSEEIYSRYNRYLLPLLEERTWSSSMDEEVASAVCLYCSLVVSESTDASKLSRAASLGGAFISLSTTARPKVARIIKNKETVMSFVLALVDSAIESCSKAEDLSLNDCRHVLDDFWKMYESLPLSGSTRVTDFGDEYSALSLRIDRLFQDLVVLDVLCRWFGHEAFALILNRRKADDGETSQQDENITVALCRSFCDQCEHIGLSRTAGTEALVRHMFQDLDNLNRLAFKDCFSIKQTLTSHLLGPLLKRRQIELLGSCLTQIKQSWIDEEWLSHEVSDLVTSAVFSDGDGVSITAAISCQDVLGRHVASLDSLFKDLRSYLDAADFINSVLLGGDTEGLLTPARIRHDGPMKTISFLLSSDPLLAIHEVREWHDAEWAQAANMSIREYYQRKKSVEMHDDPFTSDDLPPMPPGGPVLHLAHLLGVTKKDELAVVQFLLAQSCTQNNLFGASAAICRTFFIEASSPEDKELMVFAVATLVSEDGYGDVETKSELCQLVFEKFKRELTTASSFQYQRIMKEFVDIEGALLAKHEPIKNPIVSFRRLCIDTSLEYSVRLEDLFSALRNQATTFSVDDELLNTLARYTFFWCISQCTRPKFGDLVPFDESSIQSNLSLASSLALHIVETSLKAECCTQTKNTFDEQKDVALGQHHSSLVTEWVEPNRDSVKRLVGRGYSEFGARRAVVMSGNTGFDSALQWAVMHSLDKDFDSPLVVTKPRNELHLNKLGMESVNVGLQALVNLVEDWDANVVFGGMIVAHADVEQKHPLIQPNERSMKADAVTSTALTGIVKSLSDARISDLHNGVFENAIEGTPTPTTTNAHRTLDIFTNATVDPPSPPCLTKPSATPFVKTEGLHAVQTTGGSKLARPFGQEKSKVTPRNGKLIVKHVTEHKSKVLETPKTEIAPTVSTAQNVIPATLPEGSRKTTKPPARLFAAGLSMTPAQPPPQPAAPTPALCGLSTGTSQPPPQPSDSEAAGGGISTGTAQFQPRPAVAALSAIAAQPPVRPTATVNSAPSLRPRPEVRPPPPRPKLDLSGLDQPEQRSLLRERGEVALQKARNAASPSRDERRRLIEEGRRLLQVARASSGGAATTKKATVPLSSPIHQNPMRSRVGRSPPGSPLGGPKSAAALPPSPPPPLPRVPQTQPSQVTKDLLGEGNNGEARGEDGGWDFEEDDLGF